MLARYLVILVTYKENYRSFFLFKSAICQLVPLCLFSIVPYTMVIIRRGAVLGSSVLFFSVIYVV